MTLTATKTRARRIPPVPSFFGDILLTSSSNYGLGGYPLLNFFEAYGHRVTRLSWSELEVLYRNDPSFSLAPFKQIYDLDYANSAFYPDFLKSLLLDYLNIGGKLYLQGENGYFDARNSSIRDLVNNTFGGYINMGSNPGASLIARRGTNYFTGNAETRGRLTYPSTLPQLLEGPYFYNGQSYTTGPGFGPYRVIDWTATFEGNYISLETASVGFDDVEYAFWLNWAAMYNSNIGGVVPSNYRYDTTIMLKSEYMSNVNSPNARVIIALDVNYWEDWFFKPRPFASNYKSDTFWNDSYGQGQNLFASIYEQFLNAA